MIDHIDHIAKVAGIDHVGLGSDFDGVSGATPEGMDSAADLPKITQALLDRGYSAEDIHKILGGNVMRVFREVERVSHEMQAAWEKRAPTLINLPFNSAERMQPSAQAVRYRRRPTPRGERKGAGKPTG